MEIIYLYIYICYIAKLPKSSSLTHPSPPIITPFSPYSHQHLLILVLLKIGILTGVKHISLVLIFTSLMITDVEHLLKCLLAIYIYSLEKCLFRSSACFFFLLDCLLFLTLSCMSCLNILEIHPLTGTLFANIVSHSVDCPFILFVIMLLKRIKRHEWTDHRKYKSLLKFGKNVQHHLQ